MNDKIFGFEWEHLLRVQRKQASLHSHVPLVPQPLPSATDSDRAMLQKYGSIEALQAAGMHGIVDRLSREQAK